MKLIKKAGCLLLSLVLLVSMLPLTAFAEAESSLPEGFPEGYVELDLGWTARSCYNSTKSTDKRTPSQDGNANYYFCTSKFTKEDLPNGSVIVIQPGTTYQADGWANGALNTTQPTRVDVNTDAAVSYVEINDAWWGTFTERGFNVRTKPSKDLTNYDATKLAALEEELNTKFKIYVPVHEHNFENAFCTDCGALSEDYAELELTWELGYYSSTSGSKPLTDSAKAFASTQQFAKEDLPNGTIIVFTNISTDSSKYWRYRLATWKNGENKTVDAWTTEAGTVTVDDAWWGENTTCAFSVNEKGNPNEMVSRSEELKQAFKIYVPVATDEHEHDYVAEVIDPTCTEQGYTKYTCNCGHSYIGENTYVEPTGQHNFDNIVCSCGALPEDYVELELTWQLGYYDAGGTSLANYKNYATTTDFTSTTLPVGSVIVFNKPSDNWRYKLVTRSEGSTRYYPATEYTTQSGNVVVTADWWEGVAYRAFTINEQGNTSTDMSSREELKQAFKIYAYICPHDEYVKEVIAPTCTERGYTKYTCECGHSYIDESTYVDPTGQHNFENVVCSCGALPENYVKLEIEWEQGYYDRKAGQDKLPENDEFTKKFFSTQKFTKETLPVGSVIVLQPGWGCRISNWAFDIDSYQDRPDPVTATADVVYMVVTEDWWQDFDLYVFSIFEGQWAQADLTGREADVEAAFAIYVQHTCVYDKEVVAEDYKATDATCTAPATYYKSCECGEAGTDTFANGEALGHTEGTAWQSDADYHWHTCTVEGCGAVIETSKVAHTPDHEGGATEEYAIKCTICDYEIEAQLHKHKYDKEVVAEDYKATDATCTAPATYYKSCECGEKGTETFTDGEALGHAEGDVWYFDGTNHWHVCTFADCGVVIEDSKMAHNSTGDNVATCQKAAVCDVCGESYGIVADHVYKNACDADCDVCGATRTPADHVYSNDCDKDCNVCGAERTPSDHVYDHACDVDCNVCGATRTPSAHVYDDDIDTTCNVCGAVRAVGDYVAKIGKTYYESFAEAVAAAKNGDYIYILCDLEGEGIVIDKDINIVLNGFTYTITSGVGSEGTETGFQILEGCKVSISNGTIKVVEDLISVLIYSDADLTLRDMTLDGTNLMNGNESMSCTLFIGSGNVLVNNNTKIINSADNYAISVYDGYALPTLELGSKAIVEGKIYAAAKNGKYYYATLQQAIDSAAYIDLCRDYVGKGFVINKAVGINLAGYTITITEGVGSEGIGIQILSGNKVSFRNGTIQVADSAKDQIAILIQNYADLTITTVELDGKNLEAASGSCVLAINGGNAKVNGGSRILSSEREGNNNDLAVGVYADGVVQITNDVTVDGKKADESKRIHAIRCTNYYYGNLQNVLDKQSTAILMSDMEGAGVVINKNATIDFNGHTYTITSGVGSEGAETGFQILKGKVSFKNGTIQVADSAKDKIATIIQNAADLTITNVVIDANIGGENDSYIISVNSADGNDFSAIRFNNVTINGVKAEESVEIQAAAKRGLFYYASLEHAIAHKDKNSTKYDLILLGDVVLKDLAVIGGTKSLVLDLNGHTITADYDDSSDAFRILTTVTFKNGTVESNNGYCFIVGNETTAGKLVIVSGEYTAVDHDVFKLENGLLVDKKNGLLVDNRPREDATE